MILKVTGNSMWPLLKKGDFICISKTETIVNGDIITVLNSYGKILTHRVVDEINLITKGDNHVYPEKPLYGNQYKVLGKLNSIKRDNQNINIDSYNHLFYCFSKFEVKLYSGIKRIVRIDKIVYLIKAIIYSVFIFFFKRLSWKK
jgi:signal peptidase I